ncbi:MAG TPA: hypothetical protein VN922_20035 [Bacteroidia bacterium]|nr:hypothetical protein [Bacteroidia bacterium]
MLKGATLIVTPTEGGGFIVEEQDHAMDTNEVLASIGLAVVMIGVVWGVMAIADILTDRALKKLT